jgi:hypothetical protein
VRIKLFVAIIFGSMLGHQALAADGTIMPKFSDYPTAIYTGSLHIPSYYIKSGDVWRDDMDKEVSPPHINFAGKYYVGLHSCGTECRYYTLSDLAEGSESSALDIFSSDGSEPKKTSDGHNHVTELISKPDSLMVIAQYHIDHYLNIPPQCRERMFLLSKDGKKVSPISGIFNTCNTP